MREGWTSNKVDSRDLRIGDHVYVYRAMRSYSHHGIFVNQDQVIHFVNTAPDSKSNNYSPCETCGYQKNVNLGVVKTCLDCFVAKGNIYASSSLRRYQYSVSKYWYKMAYAGSCSTFDPKPPAEVVKTAMTLYSRPDGFGEYNLVNHNCENFATFCKTGQTLSAQVKRTAFYLGIIALVASGGTGAVVIAGISYKITKTSKEFIKKYNAITDNVVVVTADNGDNFGVVTDANGDTDVVKLSVMMTTSCEVEGDDDNGDKDVVKLSVMTTTSCEVAGDDDNVMIV